MEIAPFHSVKPGEIYYHNNDECSAGNLINLHDLAPGTGPFENLCPSCAQLNRAQSAQEESSGPAEEY